MNHYILTSARNNCKEKTSNLIVAQLCLGCDSVSISGMTVMAFPLC